MMPAPIANQLIDNAWDDISDAVTRGLALEDKYETPRPILDTVVVVSTDKISGLQQWKDAAFEYGPEHARVQRSGDVLDIMHRFPLSYHDLQAPDTDAIEQWAAAARRFELVVTLHEYAEHSSKYSLTPQELPQADPGGWGQRRCVSFRIGGRTPVPETWEGTGLDRLIKIDDEFVKGIPLKGTEALVFRIAGGPYVQRPADLALAWTPDMDCGAELLLTEQLKFVDVTTSNVFGINVIPSPSGGPVTTPSSG